MKNFEIDRLIARKVLGYEVNGGERIQDGKRFGIPSYSNKIEHAWEVVDRLRKTRTFQLSDAWNEDDEPVFYAEFQYNDMHHVVRYKAYADSAPMAICLAALKSVGVKL